MINPLDVVPSVSLEKRKSFRHGKEDYSFYSTIFNGSKCIQHRVSVFLDGDPNKGYLFGYFAIAKCDSDEGLLSVPSVQTVKLCHLEVAST